MLSLQRLALLAALSISGIAADTQLLKGQVAYRGGLHDPFDSEFFRILKAPEHTIRPWTSNLIPQGCKDRFVELGINPRDTEIFDVTYKDGCANPWVFCRAKNAPLSLDTMIDLFGKLPLHMRELVRHPIAVNDPSCSAYSYTTIGDIVFRGNCYKPSVWIHETAHQMDAFLHPDRAASGTPVWNDALNADTCVPDDYANNNKVEDFAQVTVTALYCALHNRSIPHADFGNDGCFNNQLNMILKYYQDRYLIGSTPNCLGQIPPSQHVSKDTPRGAKKIASSEETAVVGPCTF
ncbi:hypothetical protein ABW21_db0203567 [Orbilia brochopaga]|nr:hypothetical protein ABW21_db0203567 [Drechslerella brochopaga]